MPTRPRSPCASCPPTSPSLAGLAIAACLASIACGGREAARLAAEPPGPSAAVAPTVRPGAALGISHSLRPGQTLYAIARAYGVPLETLMRANGITDPSRLPDGLAIFVPGAARRVDVAPTFTPAPGSRAAVSSGGPDREARSAGDAFSSASMLPLPSAPGGPVLPGAAPGSGPGAPRPALDWPVRGMITSGFGRHRPRHAHHEGIDIDGVVGEPILAAASGIVRRAGREGGYGRLVIVDHGEGLTTLYAHASRLLVREGDRVETGEEIAEVGRSGNARGSHLHFEVHRDGRPVNPLPYLQASR